MENASEREREILDYIAATWEKEGYSPSVRDIKTALNIKSTSTVHTYLQRLREKGLLSKEEGKSRTLRLGAGYIPPAFSIRIPIVGRVTAGQPILATENYDGYVVFPTASGRSRAEALFALRVSGTSMIDAGILDGDLVIVEKQSVAENGDIVVAMIEDEATVKRFYKEDGHYRLQPENASMQPIIVDRVDILGRVVSSMRYYA